jgi:hypothetical protein
MKGNNIFFNINVFIILPFTLSQLINIFDVFFSKLLFALYHRVTHSHFRPGQFNVSFIKEESK